MLSLDIESLFPSIPLDETIGYATELFLKILNKTWINYRFWNYLNFVQKIITFKFADFFYKQMNSVAMKSPLAPALAKVFLTKIKNDFINKQSNHLKILFYYRFVDDIFVNLPEDENEKEFLKILNTFH